MKWYKSMFGHICRNNVLLSTSDSSFSYLYSKVLVLLNIPGTVKGQHTGGLQWLLQCIQLVKVDWLLHASSNPIKASFVSMAQQWLVNGEGLWLSSLDYLLVCYIQHSSLIVQYVVCYQSVIRNSNNSNGYVNNRELITHLTPINPPPQIQILNLMVGFFSQTHVSGGVIIKHISLLNSLYRSVFLNF